MSLINELQNKIENKKSDNEVKEIPGETGKNVEEAGVVLEDRELDKISAGFSGKHSGAIMF